MKKLPQTSTICFGPLASSSELGMNAFIGSLSSESRVAATLLFWLSLLENVDDCLPSELESLCVEVMTSFSVTRPLSFLEPISATI